MALIQSNVGIIRVTGLAYAKIIPKKEEGRLSGDSESPLKNELTAFMVFEVACLSDEALCCK